MTVIRNLHLVLMAGNRHQQVTSDVRRLPVRQALYLLLHMYLTKQQKKTAIQQSGKN